MVVGTNMRTSNHVLTSKNMRIIINPVLLEAIIKNSEVICIQNLALAHFIPCEEKEFDKISEYYIRAFFRLRIQNIKNALPVNI